MRDSERLSGQGGAHHVNEQWQSYWVEKFKARGYSADFSVRNKFWSDKRIAFWYRQNIVLYSRKPQVNPLFPEGEILDIVHPALYKECSNKDGLRWGRFQRVMRGVLQERKNRND